jgi:anti-sigma regulatory factor (Ser/Thr protein kinase)
VAKVATSEKRRFVDVSPGFQHEVLHYHGDEQFLRVLSAYIRQGLAGDEAVAVAETPRRIGLLRDALGDDARSVDFLDLTTVGGNPARIIAFWHTYFTTQKSAGRHVRGIGEPAWPGRRDIEMSEVRLHEFLVNRAFDAGPGWRLLCPYDAEHLPSDVLAQSLLTHPIELTEAGAKKTEGYQETAIMDAFGTELAPPSSTRRHDYTLETVSEVRRLVASHARHWLVPQTRIDDLVLAASEIATNSVRYGGGTGVLQLWADPDGLQVQLSDNGQIGEPLTGRRVPALDATGGRGVYLTNQLSDLVQLRSSAAGTTVRITTWLA